MAYNLKTGKKVPLKSPLTLAKKQKKMPGSVPAPKFKPRDRKAGNKYAAKKGAKKA